MLDRHRWISPSVPRFVCSARHEVIEVHDRLLRMPDKLEILMAAHPDCRGPCWGSLANGSGSAQAFAVGLRVAVALLALADGTSAPFMGPGIDSQQVLEMSNFGLAPLAVVPAR